MSLRIWNALTQMMKQWTFDSSMKSDTGYLFVMCGLRIYKVRIVAAKLVSIMVGRYINGENISLRIIEIVLETSKVIKGDLVCSGI